MEKDHRIKKFKKGVACLLCNNCNTIVKESWADNPWAIEYHKAKGTYPDGMITKEDWNSNEPLYCEKCKEDFKNNEKSI